jgi:hypothetical protein
MCELKNEMKEKKELKKKKKIGDLIEGCRGIEKILLNI